MTATAERKAKKRTTKGTKSTKAKPAIPLPECQAVARTKHGRCEINVFRDPHPGGYWKGFYEIQWVSPDGKLKNSPRRNAGLPNTSNATIAGAFDRAVMDARDELDRMRMDHLTGEQMDIIGSLRYRVDELKFGDAIIATDVESTSTGTVTKGPRRTSERPSSAMRP